MVNIVKILSKAKTFVQQINKERTAIETSLHDARNLPNTLAGVHNTERIGLEIEHTTSNVIQSAKKINVPAGKLASERITPIETDAEFKDIVWRAKDEFYSILQKEGDNFRNSAFTIIKKQMGLDGSPIKMSIVNGNENWFDASTASIYISRGWKNGSQEGAIESITHELNHLLQVKDIYVNSKFGGNGINNINPEFKKWIDSISEYNSLIRQTSAQKSKANDYYNSFKNYIELKSDLSNYSAYRKQLVEAESHKRGELVMDEFKKLKEIYHNSDPIDNLNERELDAIIKIKEKISSLPAEKQYDYIQLAACEIKNSQFRNRSEQFVNYFINTYFRT